MPSSHWTLEQKGAERVEVLTTSAKSQPACRYTLSEATSTVNPVPRKDWEMPSFSQTFPEGFDMWHTPNHWANEETTLRFTENVILQFIQDVRKLLIRLPLWSLIHLRLRVIVYTLSFKATKSSCPEQLHQPVPTTQRERRQSYLRINYRASLASGKPKKSASN